MTKNTILVLVTSSLVAAAISAPINLASSVLQSAKNAKPAPMVVSPPVQTLPAPHAAGGIAVCTTFPGEILVDGAGHVSKIPVRQDPRGHQVACGPAVPLSQAPIDPVPAHVK